MKKTRGRKSRVRVPLKKEHVRTVQGLEKRLSNCNTKGYQRVTQSTCHKINVSHNQRVTQSTCHKINANQFSLNTDQSCMSVCRKNLGVPHVHWLHACLTNPCIRAALIIDSVDCTVVAESRKMGKEMWECHEVEGGLNNNHILKNSQPLANWNPLLFRLSFVIQCILRDQNTAI
jgi:hypothetical protein